MFKKLVIPLLTAAVCAPAFAASPVNVIALRNYAVKVLPKCPDAKVTLEPVEQQGPAGFYAFVVTATSSDNTCGKQTFLLYSPATGQVVMGAVFPLAFDDRPVNVRVEEKTAELLKQNLAVTVAPFPLPDGLHAVTMTKPTPYGPFSYHGFVDATARFLIVGTRGNLTQEPHQAVLDAIGIDHAVRRGNPKAKVQIVELSDFECPTCGRAHKEVEPMIARHLDKISYARLDLPLFEHHEWAVPAALGARAIAAVAPAKYWTYVNFVFANQETIGKTNFDTFLKNFCEDHDIDWKRVETIYRSPTERGALLEQVSRAFDNGINSTPTYIINGQIMGYGPSGKFTIDAIKKALGVK